ncbi:cysteine--1-D-myo-inosityl 2-amino-2-deoxy-alpha-D-glucopyranoside ligase [Plantibacter cousiniae (nom. nud.)]|uniref:L-cysteine:1D-myo-inositol 2-amino-2-deoxy-alpha-D-glucopyranoside ligase n=1 Tax=Plantibacter cousiniae (nom. nud.) TaxID=199709 RepID=A0ABY1LM76_9MICO|nr:cysteine--1-D-myo-inosityl 2-amino-2-deoxy-alpha-D-glucopyranoside ligase [Plantibacter cousiniae]SKC60049.1 L-cysteine:1D-myo-inositol 2-amino-2-deoxy-alpha-D-glucopyranoside ligase [Plantibacter cousiniae]
MRAWSAPVVPQLPGSGTAPCLWDTPSAGLVEASAERTARLYVCGITPYDATHLGHASSYLAYDTLQRVWLDAGYEVHYAQNVTDVDDPLLERATATGVDWVELAASQVELFRSDMERLSILPPEDYVAVTEVVGPIADAVALLIERGVAYTVATPDSAAGDDVYFDVRAAADDVWHLGAESGLDEATMAAFFAERGGDPDRAGKRDAFDPLLWRAARDGEPSWESPVGQGRPGWHIECSVIALQHLGSDFTVQGGGSDLVFPHHDLSAGHAAALSGRPLAKVFSHAGMVAYEGTKMSKSLGNLVLVSRLAADGADPSAIRLAILANHYRGDWEWHDEHLVLADRRLGTWRSAFATDAASGASAVELLQAMRVRLADDLDTPGAIALVDAAATTGVDDADLARSAVDALLGVR